jgi:hypothetical protein
VLAGRARRTLVLRIALAAALAASLGGIYATARAGSERGSLLPGGRTPIVALDLSWSVSIDSYRQIAAALRDLSESNRRLGLVIFSDVAYEAFPPGTPATELRPFVRFFERRVAEQGGEPRLPPNPWSDSLSGGTRIWAALSLAREMLHRERIGNGSVVLISDLADAPNDRALLAETVVQYVQERIPIDVIALDPTPEDAELFRDTLRHDGSRVEVHAGGPVRRRLGPGNAFPAGLVAVAGVLALLLAVNEHALGPLTWRTRR